MSERRQWRVAVCAGDGVGPEVTAATVAALERLSGPDGVGLELEHLAWPAVAYHREHGAMMPADWREQLAAYDAILLGALGDPGPTDDPARYYVPDSISLEPLLKIRKGFDQWACERPAQPLDGAPRFLADPRAAEIDMLVVRENSEGEYVDQGGRLAVGTPRELATQVEVFTRSGSERIFRHAFERARRRAEERAAGHRRDRTFTARSGETVHAQVCLITKRNALRFWGEMYGEIFEEIAADYPDIAVHHELVDAACMKFVSQPWMFDVVVASNLHGDILTDLAAVLCGGLGVAPSANLNPSRRDLPPMFEPTHGSAPDIAGRNIAGPHATMLAAAMMLDWMGEEDPAAAEAGRRLQAAVAADLAAEGIQGRPTDTVGRAVCRLLDEQL